MTCKRLNQQELDRLLLTDPNPTGYPNPEDCQQRCGVCCTPECSNLDAKIFDCSKYAQYSPDRCSIVGGSMEVVRIIVYDPDGNNYEGFNFRVTKNNGRNGYPYNPGYVISGTTWYTVTRTISKTFLDWPFQQFLNKANTRHYECIGGELVDTTAQAFYGSEFVSLEFCDNTSECTDNPADDGPCARSLEEYNRNCGNYSGWLDGSFTIAFPAPPADLQLIASPTFTCNDTIPLAQCSNGRIWHAGESCTSIDCNI